VIRDTGWDYYFTPETGARGTELGQRGHGLALAVLDDTGADALSAGVERIAAALSA